MKKLLFLVLLLHSIFLHAQRILQFNDRHELCEICNDKFIPLKFQNDTLPDGTNTRLYFLKSSGKFLFPDSTIVIWSFPTKFPFPHGSDSSFFNFTDFIVDGHQPVIMLETGVFQYRHINPDLYPSLEIYASPLPSETYEIPSINLNEWLAPHVACSFRNKPIFGRVRIVANTSVADFKVRIVERDEFTSIKIVSNPTHCGEWKFVDSGENFTVKFVEYGEDFTICYRDF